MKLKLISLFVLLFMVGIATAAYLGLLSLDKTKESIQHSGSQILIEQITKRSKDLTHFNKQKLEYLFADVESNLLELKRAAHRYNDNPELFDLKANWNIDERLVHLPNNQLTNKPGDISSVFTPVQLQASQEVRDAILQSALLDLDFEKIYALNSNTVALYFLGIEGHIRYYPSFDITNVVPKNYEVLKDEVMQSALPENNPQGKVVWTAVYEDAAGKGSMVTASVPVFVKKKFIGLVGVDVTIENVLRDFIAQEFSNESFVLNADLKPIIVNEQFKSMMLETNVKKNGESPSFKLVDELEHALAIMDKKKGFKSVEVAGKLAHINITKIERLNWYYVTVLAQEELTETPEKLSKELDNVTDALIVDSIILYLIISVVFSILIYWIIDMLLAPILELTNVSKLIANGNIDQEIDIDGKDEIKTLIDSFKLMQHSIIKQQTNLQDTVETTSQQLLEQKNLFSELYKNSSDGLSIMIDGQFIDCNDALLKMFKIETREELKNMLPGRLAPETQPDGIDSSEMFKKGLAQCLKNGFSHHERLVNDTEGNEFWVDAMLIKVNDDEKNIIYSIARAIAE